MVDYDSLARENKYRLGHPARHTSSEIFKFFQPRGRLLDLGLGPGDHSTYFLARGLEVVGVDISLVQLKKSGFIRVVLGDAQHLPFKEGSFDSVLCSELLEHLSYPGQCIQEIHRILREGGSAVFTTPCLNIPIKGLIPLYRKLAKVDLRKDEHLRVYSAEELMAELRGFFKIVDVKYKDFTAVLKYRWSTGYRIDSLLSDMVRKIPPVRYFAASVFIKVVK